MDCISDGWRPWKSLGEKFCFPDNFCCFKMIFLIIFLVLLVANLCFAWRSQGCKRCSHRKLKCYKTSLQVVVQPLNYNFPPLKQHIRCTSSSGSGGGAGPPLPLIFEAPDYILRPKLRIFWADQSWPPPPWPNPGSVIDLIWQS